MIDLAINVTKNDDWQVITLKGELDDYQAAKLTQTFNQIIGNGDTSIILNLNEVTFIDSVGLGTIAIAGKKLCDTSGHLFLVSNQHKISKMVTLSGIISATKQTIQLFPTVEDATTLPTN